MLVIRTRLMAASALVAAGLLSSQTAGAQTGDSAAAKIATPGQAASSTSKASENSTPEAILKDIVVKGRKNVAAGLMIVQREPETTNSLSAEAITKKMALAGPYQIMATLPGVASGQSDPYQMSVRYAMFLRGLPQTDIGWVIDGAPGMTQSYQNPYAETWVDNENIAGITVLPGSTRITDPAQTAVAGEVIETTRDPKDEAGVRGSYSYGSYRASRVFVGLDTGYIGKSGVKAYANVSVTKAGSYALPDDASGHRTHVDAKFEKDWGDVGKSTLFVSYNDWSALRSLAYTLAQYRADQATGDFTVGNYAGTFNPLSSSNNYYKAAQYTRRNVFIISNNEINASDRLKINVTPYYHWTYTNSPGEGSLNPNSLYSGSQKVSINTAGLFLLPNGNIPVKSNTLQHENAMGVNSNAKYEISPSNHVQFGWWYDHWSMDNLASYTPLSGTGDGADWGRNPLVDTNGNIIAAANYKMHSNVNSLTVQDTQSFLDGKLTIEAGLKYFLYAIAGDNLANGGQGHFSQQYSKVLPRGTISYEINSRSQVYADIITEARTNVPISTYPNTYIVSTGAISQLGTNTAKPETSIGEEIGYRYHDNVLTADIAIFNKKLSNHSVVSQAYLNGAGVSTAINAGGVRMRGATVELALKPFYGFSPYVNGQYLEAKTTDNLQVGNDYLPTAGKVGVQAPKWVVTGGINYDHGPIFGNVIAKYTSSQYSTFMNDEKMPAYTTVDVTVGYRLPLPFLGKDPVLRLSITNLGNKPYLSTYSSVTTNKITTTGINGTTIAGSAPSYWLASPRAIMGTFSTSF